MDYFINLLSSNFLFQTIAVFVLSVIGGIIFRWRGGGEPVGLGRFMPRPIDQILFSSIYIYIAFALFPNWQAFILSVITVVMVSRGHGRNMDLGYSDEKFPNATPEWYEPLILGLYGRLPNGLYDFIGLMISGMTYTFPLGLLIADPAGDYFEFGVLLTLSGALKAPAYVIGRWVHKSFTIVDHIGSEGTDVVRLKDAISYGEFFCGFVLWGSAAILIIKYMF